MLRDRHHMRAEFRLNDLCELWEKALGKSIDVGLLGRVLRAAMNRGLLPGLRPRSKKNGSPWMWDPCEFGEGAPDEQVSREAIDNPFAQTYSPFSS